MCTNKPWGIWILTLAVLGLASPEAGFLAAPAVDGLAALGLLAAGFVLGLVRALVGRAGLAAEDLAGPSTALLGLLDSEIKTFGYSPDSLIKTIKNTFYIHVWFCYYLQD